MQIRLICSIRVPFLDIEVGDSIESAKELMMKAMVVDDEKDVELLFRQYFRKEMRQNQIEFIFAFSAEEALQLLRALNQPPEIMFILSDINMPGMNGLELLQIVKKEFPDIKVSMITAYSNQYYDAAMEYGAEHYFTKPLDFAVLKQQILKG